MARTVAPHLGDRRRGDGDIDALPSGAVEPCRGRAITPFVGDQDSSSQRNPARRDVPRDRRDLIVVRGRATAGSGRRATVRWRQHTRGAIDIVLPIIVGLAGIFIGALLTRRNARIDHADKLLADALNDLVAAIADVAGGDVEAQRRYAAATSRIVLHGSPQLVAAFRAFQDDATTASKRRSQTTLCKRHAANSADPPLTSTWLPSCFSAPISRLERAQIHERLNEAVVAAGAPPSRSCVRAAWRHHTTN